MTKEIVYSFVQSMLLISILYRSASGYFLSSSRKNAVLIDVTSLCTAPQVLYGRGLVSS